MGKISYKKGLDFENEVAKFIVEELKYDDTAVRPVVKGSTSNKGFEIDVLAKINDKGSDAMRVLARIFIFVGGFFMLSCIFGIVQSFAYMILGFIFVLIAVIYIFKIQELLAKYSWVECKNLKNRVNRNQIIELVYKYKDYEKQKEKRYNIINKMYFSASGYNADAKSFAKENGVICFEKNDKNQFVKTNLDF